MALATFWAPLVKNGVSPKKGKVLKKKVQKMREKMAAGLKETRCNFFGGLSFYFGLFSFYKVLIIPEPI